MSKNKHNGITLVEFVILIVIISFSLVSFFKIWSYYTKQQIQQLRILHDLDRLEWLAKGIANKKLCVPNYINIENPTKCLEISKYGVIPTVQDINFDLNPHALNDPKLGILTLSFKKDTIPAITLIVEIQNEI